MSRGRKILAGIVAILLVGAAVAWRDPTEQTNLAEHEPERLAALQAKLATFNAEQAEPLWPSLVEVPINIDKTLLGADAPDDEYIYWPN